MNLSSNIQLPQLPHIKISIRILAFILAILGGIFFYWTSTSKVPEIEEKTSQIAVENESLSKTEANLAEMYNNMNFYKEETKKLQEKTDKILEQFPTFMYLEDKILYADTLLKNELKGFNINNIAYGQSNFVMSVTYGGDALNQGPQLSQDNQQQNTQNQSEQPQNNQAQNNQAQSEQPQGEQHKGTMGENANTKPGNLLELYSVNLSGKYQDLTYPQVKKILDYGLTSPQRFVMDNITIGYTEKSGLLSGELSFTTYFIPGQSTPYVFPKQVVEALGKADRTNDLFASRK